MRMFLLVFIAATYLWGSALQAEVPGQDAGKDAGLPAQAATLEAFVPAGWRIEHRLVGALDDGPLDGAVLILRDTDPAKVLSGAMPDVMLPEDVEVDTNRRIIVVLLGSPTGYRLIGYNAGLIPAPDSELVLDPLEFARIVKGTLRLDISFFATMGTWHESESRFDLRYDGYCMRLLYVRVRASHRADNVVRTQERFFSGASSAAQARVAAGNTLDLPLGPCLEVLTDAWETDWFEQ